MSVLITTAKVKLPMDGIKAHNYIATGCVIYVYYISGWLQVATKLH